MSATDLEVLSKDITSMAISKGFWDAIEELERPIDSVVKAAKATKVALMHSELSELLERIREATDDSLPMSDKIPDFSGEEEELADLIIRALDYAGYFNMRITKAIYAKMAYNAGRPHKHGKAF